MLSRNSIVVMSTDFGWKGRPLPNYSTLSTVLKKHGTADQEIDMIYLDLSKAFDSVPHDPLLGKLNQFDISDSLLNWFKDYLTAWKKAAPCG